MSPYSKISQLAVTLSILFNLTYTPAQSRLPLKGPESQPLLSVQIPLNTDLQVGVFKQINDDTAVGLGYTYQRGALAARVAADVSSGQQHVLGSLGYDFSYGYAMIGLSQAREDLRGKDALGAAYDAKLKGSGAFGQLALTNVNPWLRRVFVDVSEHRAKDAHLATSSREFSTSSNKDVTSSFQTDNAVMSRTTRYTTTETFRETIRTDFAGGKARQIRLGADIKAHDNGLITVAANRQSTEIPTLDKISGTYGSATYTHYWPELNMNVGLGLDSEHRIALSLNKQLSPTLALRFTAEANTRNNSAGDKPYSLFTQLQYSFGTDYNLGTIPSVVAEQLRERLNQQSTQSSEQVRNVAALGKVIEQRVIESLGKTTDTQIISESTIAIPKNPIADCTIKNLLVRLDDPIILPSLFDPPTDSTTRVVFFVYDPDGIHSIKVRDPSGEQIANRLPSTATASNGQNNYFSIPLILFTKYYFDASHRGDSSVFPNVVTWNIEVSGNTKCSDEYETNTRQLSNFRP